MNRMTAEAFFNGMLNGITAPARMVGIPIPTVGGNGGGGAPQKPQPPTYVEQREAAEFQQKIIAGAVAIVLLIVFK